MRLLQQSHAGALSRFMPRRVRMRLTVLYGVLFVASGAVLLVITYVLVSRRKPNVSVYRGPLAGGTVLPDGQGGTPGMAGQPPRWADGVARELGDQALRQHAQEMHHLLVQSGIALGIMAVIATLLSWLAADRVVRPLRTMTSTIRQISARNVHERLAVAGPTDELKDLADTVDGLLGRLQTALESHERFVANAAHELRTPLTLEHALLEETLMDRYASVESFQATFDRLLMISKQQARLLESLLTLSSSERGLEQPEPLDLCALAEDVLLTFCQEIDRRGLHLEAAMEPASLSGDPALVRRLVANLLDNAIDYNVPGGRVKIATGTTSGRAFVSVANTGPAIPPEQVDRLLEPFQRLVRTAGDGHHGLGLSIVRAIATAHGATLTARARPGGGLIMEVAFPTGGIPSYAPPALADRRG